MAILRICILMTLLALLAVQVKANDNPLLTKDSAQAIDKHLLQLATVDEKQYEVIKKQLVELATKPVHYENEFKKINQSTGKITIRQQAQLSRIEQYRLYRLTLLKSILAKDWLKVWQVTIAVDADIAKFKGWGDHKTIMSLLQLAKEKFVEAKEAELKNNSLFKRFKKSNTYKKFNRSGDIVDIKRKNDKVVGILLVDVAKGTLKAVHLDFPIATKAARKVSGGAASVAKKGGDNGLDSGDGIVHETDYEGCVVIEHGCNEPTSNTSADGSDLGNNDKDYCDKHKSFKGVRLVGFELKPEFAQLVVKNACAAHLMNIHVVECSSKYYKNRDVKGFGEAGFKTEQGSKSYCDVHNKSMLFSTSPSFTQVDEVCCFNGKGDITCGVVKCDL